MEQLIGQFVELIQHAGAANEPLSIQGSGSKQFYGGAPMGALLNTTEYVGIIDYDPKELVVTARAGTPLTEIQVLLLESRQMLAFEPPHYGLNATLGGCVAAGLSGPRRPYAGAVRDFVLGVRILDGQGSDLKFGGTVIKNVAGYDVSRLMTGALGTLGLLLDISVRVNPLPAAELTLAFEVTEEKALQEFNRWAGIGLPLSASCFYEDRAYVRLSGAASATAQGRHQLGGEEVAEGAQFWRRLREQTHHFFQLQESETLWRVSLPTTSPALSLPGRQLVEWGGGLRWLVSAAEAPLIRAEAEALGGSASAFRGSHKPQAVFHPLSPGMLTLHRELKKVFDPKKIFNRSRLYPEF